VSAVWPLVSARTMRALDQHTIETLGVPADLLMESAGRAVADVVLSALEPGDSVLCVCGGGNNGGDGLVVARHLHLLGVPVRVSLLSDPGRLRGDPGRNLERARAVGVPLAGADFELPEAGVVVDALFGTGLSRDVEGAPAEAIRRIARAREARPGLAVVAVDLPSGLDADTGGVWGVAVDADATVTIGLPKLGLALEPGRTLAGDVVVARVGIADEAPGVAIDAEVWTRAAAAGHLPERPAHAHKGSFGHVLLVAASEGKTGAAALAASGAGRTGAGLVTVACPAGVNDVLEVKLTEAMTAPVAEGRGRTLAAGAEAAIAALAAERDAVGLGPGVGREDETVSLVRALAKRIERPLALDADGLFAFAGEPGLLRDRPAATVLTPHPGEAARLLGVSAGDVNADRVGAARRLAEASGCVVLLKGAASVIASPQARTVVNPTGGPALASGGTGDVLLGMVTALLAQGLPPLEAAALAAFVHGVAADRIAERTGQAGLLAGDLLPELPAAMEALRAERGRALPESLATPFPEP